METHLADFVRGTPAGIEAERILRACVHCGFCTATCPTYQLTGDELDGPRGRIYLIKQLLEGQAVTDLTRHHLDRCLVCRSCETTCPSGVDYHRLLDIGQQTLAERHPRRGIGVWSRALLRNVLRRRRLFGLLLGAGKLVRGVLPAALAAKLPSRSSASSSALWPHVQHPRRMLVLQGCVQDALAPSINIAAARLLDAAGVSLQIAPSAGCCGALRAHNDDHAGGLDDARALIDAWWPMVAGDAGGKPGVEAIVITTSGCGAHIRDYPKLLASDPAYADKAKHIAALARDVSEVIAGLTEALLPQLSQSLVAEPIAFHSPCSLQHGQRVRGTVERLLGAAGFKLLPVRDSHLCCGSAGTYALLQCDMSGRLRDNKLEALLAGKPLRVATANIGCQSHLQAGTNLPVQHWVELLAERLP